MRRPSRETAAIASHRDLLGMDSVDYRIPMLVDCCNLSVLVVVPSSHQRTASTRNIIKNDDENGSLGEIFVT